MNKQIFVAFSFNEAEAFPSVEPFYGTVFHVLIFEELPSI